MSNKPKYDWADVPDTKNKSSVHDHYVRCTECGALMSDPITECPACGAPNGEMVANGTYKKASPKNDGNTDPAFPPATTGVRKTVAVDPNAPTLNAANPDGSDPYEEEEL